MRVVGYVRVSTDGQAESGAGLEAQETAIRVEFDRRGWELLRIARDTGSAKTMDKRLGLAEALDDLDAHDADCLVAAKLDRLSRSVVDFGNIIQRADRRSWTVVVLDVAVDTSTPSGELLVNVMASFAQFERRIIGQRTKDALAAKKAAGVQLGRPRSLDPAVRARIVAERAAGRSFRAIAADLTAEAVPTARGGAEWQASSIRAIVQSPERPTPKKPKRMDPRAVEAA